MALVLITGASRGIGRALSEAYSARGDHVIATVRDLAQARALGASRGGVIDYLPADVTDEASLAALADALGGRALDVLVVNAGVFLGRGRLEDPDYDRAAWERVLLTNVFGVFATIRALAPALTQGGGKAAVISSQMGSTAQALEKGGSYAYRASKAAAVNLARNIAADLAPRGVAVGAYHPGWVRTDMGGAGADIAVEDSAAGLLRRIDALSLATTGVFEDYLGRPIPF